MTNRELISTDGLLVRFIFANPLLVVISSCFSHFLL